MKGKDIAKELQDDSKLFYTIAELEKVLGISRMTLYNNYIYAGKLPAKRLGRKIIVLKEDLFEFLESLPSVVEGAKKPSSRRIRKEAITENSNGANKEEKPFYTISELALMLDCSPQNIYNYIRKGMLPAKRPAGKIVIPKRDFFKYLESLPYVAPIKV